MSSGEYLRAVEDMLRRGMVPASQRQWIPVQTRYGARVGVFFVQGLQLACGTNDNVFHAAVTVGVAQRVADSMGAMLPTRKMVDIIHAQATTRVPFRAFTSDRSSVGTFVASSIAIEDRRAGRGGLVSDYGKDYVITNQRRANPSRIAIYGAWESAGSLPVQPLATPHSLSYYDYSQHARMVRNDVIVDGVGMALSDALERVDTALLFSSEGPIRRELQRYPA